MGQVVQVAGSLLVLAGFALAQRGVLGTTSRRYLALNVLGSAVLAVEALRTSQWGFLLLEGVWALISGVGLARAMAGTVVARRVHRRAADRRGDAGEAGPAATEGTTGQTRSDASSARP